MTATASLSVCLFSDVSLPALGGAQTVLDCLARRLVAAGHRAVVVAPRPREPWDDARLGYPVVRHRRPFSKRVGTRLLLPRLLALHRRERFDLVHCHAAYPQAHVAATLRRLSGVPFVVRPHGCDVLPGEAIRRSPRLEARMKAALAAADLVIAQGEFLRGVIAEAGVTAERIRVVNNGVDVSEFRAAEPWPHPRPYLLGVGSLVPHKGFDLLLRAYALLPADRPDLLIAGDGPERERLGDLARRLGIDRQVHLLGPVTGGRKVSLYRSATCFVCPSRREPFANVLLEALAAGLPAVATDVGGNREIVRDGENGLLCQPESPADLAAALDRLVADASLATHLRRGAATTIRRFDWPAVADRYIDLYREVVAARRATASRAA
jgi:glycosyltransferase involved in cell wall biosynthesis